MKNLFFFLIAGLVAVFSFAHPVQEAPAGDIPPFKILRTNGRFFTAAELPKNKPVLLIYFAPDCGHCITLMNDFFRHVNAFKGVTVVMATFKPLDELSGFERRFKTASYANIITGTEGNTFFLRYHYNVANTPFTVLFDKDGKQVKVYTKETIIQDLLAQVKQLKG